MNIEFLVRPWDDPGQGQTQCVPGTNPGHTLIFLLEALKTLTSLNKEVRPFSLGDKSIWSFPLFLPLAITAFGGPEGYFSLAIIAFGAIGAIVPKCYYRLGKMEKRSLDPLI